MGILDPTWQIIISRALEVVVFLIAVLSKLDVIAVRRYLNRGRRLRKPTERKPSGRNERLSDRRQLRTGVQMAVGLIARKLRS